MSEPFFPEYLTPLIAKAADELIKIIISRLAVYPDLDDLRQKLEGDSPEKSAIQRALHNAYLEFSKQHPDLAIAFFTPEFLLHPEVISQISRLFASDQEPEIDNLVKTWKEQLWYYPVYQTSDTIKELISTIKTANHAEFVLTPFFDSTISSYFYQLFASPRRPFVNFGWAPFANPVLPLDLATPLNTGQEYYFFLNLTNPATDPMGVQLTVSLVGYTDNLIVDPDACTAKIILQPNDACQIISQPLGAAAPKSPGINNTLFFRLKTPTEPGMYRMRCSFYYGQLLLQSYLVKAIVQNPARHASLPPGSHPVKSAEAAASIELDYHLAMPVTPAELAAAGQSVPHILSILVDDQTNGTCSLHIKGNQDGIDIKQDDIRFDQSELDNLISRGRAALHRISWGNQEEWRDQFPFRYQDQQLYLDRLTSDLSELARIGSDLFDRICRRLPGGKPAIDQFGALLKKTGYIQIALKSSPGCLLPVALIYDYPLDLRPDARLTLCRDFSRALNEGRDLANEPCFFGHCAAAGDPNVICPGGFWGFRHYLGLPVSLKGRANTPFSIPACETPHLLIGEYTDLLFLQEHEDFLRSLPVDLLIATDRDGLLAGLTDPCTEIVYYYSQGGLVSAAPYPIIGSHKKPVEIRSADLIAQRIRWQDDPHPLIFLNGCRTAAVNPIKALEYLQAMIHYAQAAGVISPEITINEVLAKVFAESFFNNFVQGETVGKSLRSARLAILAQGNPLGLGYVPFTHAGLVLSKADPEIERLFWAARQDVHLSKILGRSLTSGKTMADTPVANARLLRRLGTYLTFNRDHYRARPYLEKALAICGASLGENHPDTATSYYRLGYLLSQTGKYTEALPCYEQALAINRATLGLRHPTTAANLNNLGILCKKMNDYPAARLHFEQALAIYDAVLGSGSPQAQTVRRNLSTLPKA